MTIAEAGKFTLLFPMAGREAHAGSRYKPFMKIRDQWFIEAAFNSFRPWISRVGRVVFTCLEEQNEQFFVGERLRRLFRDLEFDLTLLPEPTSGPLDTIVQSIRLGELAGPGIVCDCDHALGLNPLIQRIDEKPDITCILPTWSLRGESLKDWSVASIDEVGCVNDIAEKRIPPGPGSFVGVIGCYYFGDLSVLGRMPLPSKGTFVSDAIKTLIESGHTIEAVPLDSAVFFGDVERQKKAETLAPSPQGTIFCDLDGTLIKHQDEPSYGDPLVLIPGAVEKVREWYESGFHIVLSTSRNSADEPLLRQALAQANVPHHRLLMGLPSGPRFIVNDRKPSAIFHPQAYAFEVERNQGIQHLELPDWSQLHVLRRFRGGSLAETLLLENADRSFIRKRITKRENLTMGYGKLKQQYRTLDRFARLTPALIPELYGDHEDTLEYYYDLEYLSRHKPLYEVDEAEQVRALDRLLGMFEERVYRQRHNEGSMAEWLEHHLATKIYPKLDSLRNHPRLGRLIYGEPLQIDGQEVPTLWECLERLLTTEGLERFKPNSHCLVHGDLTFGNILCLDGDVKVIDMDSGNQFEAPELDLGKLFQSLIGHFETWERATGTLVDSDVDGALRLCTDHADNRRRLLEVALDHWSKILGCGTDRVYEKGVFYMCLHLIRLIPYRIRISEEQSLLSLVIALKWMDRLLHGLS